MDKMMELIKQVGDVAVKGLKENHDRALKDMEKHVVEDVKKYAGREMSMEEISDTFSLVMNSDLPKKQGNIFNEIYVVADEAQEVIVSAYLVEGRVNLDDFLKDGGISCEVSIADVKELVNMFNMAEAETDGQVH